MRNVLLGGLRLITASSAADMTLLISWASSMWSTSNMSASQLGSSVPLFRSRVMRVRSDVSLQSWPTHLPINTWIVWAAATCARPSRVTRALTSSAIVRL
ncbi:hypothetical protein T492DRAFT_981054 [Pavlovales sp. CCMP2436]|nr:hypothetical protein T492DRAFT_981054 [Pavlovales sp. CCMP2436]